MSKCSFLSVGFALMAEKIVKNFSWLYFLLGVIFLSGFKINIF